MRTILAGIAGTFAAVIGIIVFFLIGKTDNTAINAAAPTPDVVAERQAPATRANPMTPVTPDEAARRAELHERLATPEAARRAAAMAPSVITEVRDASLDDPLSRELFGEIALTTPEVERVEAQPEPEPAPEPVVAEVEPEPEPEPQRSRFNPNNYRERFRVDAERPATNFGIRSFAVDPRTLPVRPGDDRGAFNSYEGLYSPFGGLLDPMPLDDESRVALREALGLDSMYSSLFSRSDDRFGEPVLVADGYGTGNGKYGDYSLSDPVVRPQFDWPAAQGYAAPNGNERSAARPAMVGVDHNGNPYTTSDAPNPYLAAQNGATVLARNGDLLYASLVYGFNSDDVRGLPIYARITDFLPNGTVGPLNGAQVQGQVAYNSNNAAIIFDRVVLPNGREFAIEAIAVSDQGRTGVADRVNRHTLARYGSLFLSGIIQGIGEVAQFRLNDRNSDQPVIIINEGGGSVNYDRDNNEPTDREILAGALAPVGRNMTAAAQSGFNRPPTISAPAGMPFALVFTATVVSDPATGRTAFNPRTGRTEVVGEGEAMDRRNEQIPTTGMPGAPMGGQGGVSLTSGGDAFRPASEGPPGAVWQSLSGQ